MKKATEFIGTVNGKKFGNVKEWSEYISYLTDKGVDIEETSSYSSTKWVVDEEENRKEFIKTIKEDTLKEDVLDPVPAPYKDVIDYLVPRIEEDVFTGDNKSDQKILDDLREKLVKRQVYYVDNEHKLREGQINELVKKGNKKVDWCDESIKKYTLKSEELQYQINELRAQIEKYNNIIEAYCNVAGYMESVLANYED